jgi:threonine/homoserine/homoserine lactone efflux protein
LSGRSNESRPEFRGSHSPGDFILTIIVPFGLRDGIATNLANPKSMAFYASVFSGAVPTDPSMETLLAIMVMVGVLAVLWYEAWRLSCLRIKWLICIGKASPVLSVPAACF